MSATMLLANARSFSRFRSISGILPRFLSSNANSPDKPSNESTKGVTSSVDDVKSSEDVAVSSNIGESSSATTTQLNAKIGGFARAFERIEKLSQEDEQKEEEPRNFASMIRQSKLMQIGDPDGRVVLGTIFDVVEDDLYIDFGGKFHCVCKRPSNRSSDYKQGVRVKLRLKDLEMTSKFLGSDKYVTLLEADAILIGLHRPREWTKFDNRPNTAAS